MEKDVEAIEVGPYTNEKGETVPYVALDCVTTLERTYFLIVVK